ncbi:hypothetical protein QJS04_geneDACA006432 [Acorus gramineus]|uniref:Uncharacterized protein n=1 Tax=Acorus gramineus TaxID=55184 RepID=A0AAV9AYL3_ACOGR|nr:hypothetical protein QJS04_geneDACA006432 [Acorus gramineus]
MATEQHGGKKTSMPPAGPEGWQSVEERRISRDDGGGAVDAAEAPKRFLVTRDLLGECARRPQKELDLDLRVPIGWEKRLDLQSGKVYIQKSSAPSVPALSRPSLHDLNFQPWRWR